MSSPHDYRRLNRINRDEEILREMQQDEAIIGKVVDDILPKKHKSH